MRASAAGSSRGGLTFARIWVKTRRTCSARFGTGRREPGVETGWSDLKELLDTTDGNLSVHARKLEEAGYITCTKSFEDRRPKTEYGLTAAGQRALQKYLDHMERLIKSARGS